MIYPLKIICDTTGQSEGNPDVYDANIILKFTPYEAFVSNNYSHKNQVMPKL